MRAFVLASLLAAFCSANAAQAGTSGLYLPSAPTGPGGEDAIETSSGTRCRQSINSNGAYLDIGVAGSAGSEDRDDVRDFIYRDTRPREATGYARVTIPLGARPQRIDCRQLYELEIAKLKREVELLKLGVR